jgi:hypothetical protein
MIIGLSASANAVRQKNGKWNHFPVFGGKIITTLSIYKLFYTKIKRCNS